MLKTNENYRCGKMEDLLGFKSVIDLLKTDFLSYIRGYSKNSMKKIILLILIIIPLKLISQTVEIDWQKLYGGGQEDKGQKIIYSHEGGFILMGSAESENGDFNDNFGSDDYVVINTDLEGNVNWAKNYGGGNTDVGKDLVQTPDGGYILLGDSRSDNGQVSNSHGERDLWAVKIDGSGNLIWEKSYGGSNQESASSIHATPDGNYLITATTTSNDGDVSGYHGNNAFDAWVLKIDPQGNILWGNCYGGTQTEFSIDALVTPENEYIIVGNSASANGDLSENYGDQDGWVFKLNSMGEFIFNKTYGGSCGDYLRTIRPSSNGYLISGYSCSNDFDVSQNNGQYDYWILEIDTEGNLIWEKSLGGSEWDQAFSAQQIGSGYYIITGHSQSNDGDLQGNYGVDDAWTAVLDNNHNILWEKNMGGTGYDGFFDFLSLNDNSIMMIGNTSSNDFDITNNNGSFDFWLLKLNLTDLGIAEIQEPGLYIYPNPSKNTVNFSESVKNLIIYDLNGKIVLTHIDLALQLNISNLPEGNYIITSYTKEGKKFTQKLIKKNN
jgi:hypothetical protein